jgi:saccharopine dehydrogenase-like NADP-dependent oxidoreductase
MKEIVLFGAGKSATCLIDYLIQESAANDWHLTVADSSLEQALSKTGNAANTKALALDVSNETERRALVSGADIVVSLLPAALHFLIAQDCLAFNKNLLTASYIDDALKTLKPEVERKGLLFLCEMGLDPGIDHMSAMQLIHRIKAQGAAISSFKSHTGGLIAPESDDNPWHYKISWNPRNIVMAGAAGAVYKENTQVISKKYEELFKDCMELSVPGAGQFAYYPNRDSLSYIPVYALEQAATFIRTTLRHPDFCKDWAPIVAAGLTDDKKNINTRELPFKKWSAPIIPFVNNENESRFNYLGFFDETPVPDSAKTNADVLQYLLETKLIMHADDKDMIIMLHELEYEIRNTKYEVRSSLIVKGENSVKTAMAKTVGLPLGIATKLILLGKINLKGLHIPILPEIYEPVLRELQAHRIRFTETIS